MRSTSICLATSRSSSILGDRDITLDNRTEGTNSFEALNDSCGLIWTAMQFLGLWPVTCHMPSIDKLNIPKAIPYSKPRD